MQSENRSEKLIPFPLPINASIEDIDSETTLVKAIMQAAVDQKALDIKALDVRDICSFADYLVISSGTSQRHVQGICDKIEKTLRSAGRRCSGLTGREQGEWIVMDYDNIVVHVFFEPTRQFYALDQFWAQGAPLEIEPDLQDQIRRFRTGVFG